MAKLNYKSGAVKNQSDSSILLLTQLPLLPLADPAYLL